MGKSSDKIKMAKFTYDAMYQGGQYTPTIDTDIVREIKRVSKSGEMEISIAREPGYACVCSIGFSLDSRVRLVIEANETNPSKKEVAFHFIGREPRILAAKSGLLEKIPDLELK